MRITLPILADEIRKDYPGATFYGGENADISDVQFWKDGDKKASKNTLYLIPSKGSLPDILRTPDTYKVCFDKSAMVPGMILLTGADPLRTLTRFQAILVRLLLWQKQMLEFAKPGADIQQLLEISLPVIDGKLSFSSLYHEKLYTTASEIPSPNWWDSLFSPLNWSNSYIPNRIPSCELKQMHMRKNRFCGTIGRRKRKY